MIWVETEVRECQKKYFKYFMEIIITCQRVDFEEYMELKEYIEDQNVKILSKQ